MIKEDSEKSSYDELSLVWKILLPVAFIIFILTFALWVYGIFFEVGLNPTG